MFEGSTCLSPYMFKSLVGSSRPTVGVSRMSLFGRWPPRILVEISSPGTRTGRERLGCPVAGMGTFSPQLKRKPAAAPFDLHEAFLLTPQLIGGRLLLVNIYIMQRDYAGAERF